MKTLWIILAITAAVVAVVFIAGFMPQFNAVTDPSGQSPATESAGPISTSGESVQQFVGLAKSPTSGINSVGASATVLSAQRTAPFAMLAYDGSISSAGLAHQATSASTALPFFQSISQPPASLSAPRIGHLPIRGAA